MEAPTGYTDVSAYTEKGFVYLYTPYLEEIGAVSDQSDAIAGSMCWCPITNLDSADAAYASGDIL